MKRTQIKDSLKNIWKQKVSFLSVIIIAMLGVTAFLGIDYSATAMRKDGSDYYNAHNFRDIEVLSTLMFSESDTDRILAVDGVVDAEKVRAAEAEAVFGEEMIKVNAVSGTERINISEATSGRLPTDKNECAIEKKVADALKISVGDKIKLLGSDGKAAKYLIGEEYTVTGIMIHPDNINIVAPYTPYVLVTWDAFDDALLKGSYMKTEVVIDKPEGIDRFSDEYINRVADIINKIELVSIDAAQERDTEFKKLYDTEILEGEKKLEQAKTELDDGRKLLDEKTGELKDGEEKIALAESKLPEAEKQLEDGKTLLDESKKKLDDGKALLEANRAKLKEGKAQLDEGKAKLDDAKAQLIDGYAQIEDAKQQVRDKLKSVIDKIPDFGLLEGIIKWSKPEKADLKDESKKAVYFNITENLTVDISFSFEKTFENIINKRLSDRTVLLIYKVVNLKDAPKNSSGEYDYDKIRKSLNEKVKETFKDYTKLSEACKSWDKGREEYLAGLKKYEDSLKQYNAGAKEFSKAEAQYKAGEKEYLAGLEKYNNGKEEYEKGLVELEEGKAAVEEGRIKLKEGEEKYENGLAEYESGLEKLEKARESLSNIDPCKWIAYDVRGNLSYVQLTVGSSNFSNLKVTFSLMFVVVGALVIYATTGKMVDEQRSQIGVTKALGFFYREIFAKYLIFGVSATLLGTIFGIILASVFIEPFLLNGFDVYYLIDMTGTVVSFLPTLIAIVAGILLAVVSVWFACNRLLKEPAIRLMSPKVPGVKKGSGKKSKMSLYSRLILLNIRTDLKRVIVTIVSVAGCCALVVTGFTLRDSVNATPDMQFGQITDYDICIKYSNDASEENVGKMKDILSKENTEYINLIDTQVTYRLSELQLAELMAGDIEQINNYYHLNDIKTGKELYPTDEGVFIQRKISERYGLEVGDFFELTLGGTKVAKVRVSAIFENYIGRAIVMSNVYYERVFGTDYIPNAFFVKLNGVDASDITKKFEGINSFESVTYSDSDRRLVVASTSMVNTTVLIFIAIAGLMAAAVLLNLTNMYILQKKRELVIMRVNGFTTKEVISYVLRETVVTTILGVILGIAIGSLLSYIIIITLEQAFIQFVRTPDFIAWAIGVGITVFFTVIVNIIALRKVKNLKLTDIA